MPWKYMLETINLLYPRRKNFPTNELNLTSVLRRYNKADLDNSHINNPFADYSKTRVR